MTCSISSIISKVIQELIQLEKFQLDPHLQLTKTLYVLSPLLPLGPYLHNNKRINEKVIQKPIRVVGKRKNLRLVL